MRRFTTSDNNIDIKPLEESEKLKAQMAEQKEEQAKNSIKQKDIGKAELPKKKIVVKKSNGRIKKVKSGDDDDEEAKPKLSLDMTPAQPIQVKDNTFDKAKQQLRQANVFMANAAMSAQGQPLTEEEKRMKDFIFNKNPAIVNRELLRLDEEAISEFTLMLLKLSSQDLNDFMRILQVKTGGFLFANMVPQVRETLMSRINPMYRQNLSIAMHRKDVKILNNIPGRDDLGMLGYGRDSIAYGNDRQRREFERNKYGSEYGDFGELGQQYDQYGRKINPWNNRGFGNNGFGFNNNRNGYNNNSFRNNGFYYGNNNDTPQNRNDYEIKRLKDSLKDAEKRIDDLKKAKDYPSTPALPSTAPPVNKDNKNAIPGYDSNVFANEVIRRLEDSRVFDRQQTTKIAKSFDSTENLIKFGNLLQDYNAIVQKVFGNDVLKILGNDYHRRPFDDFLNNQTEYGTSQFDDNITLFNQWLGNNSDTSKLNTSEQVKRNREIANVQKLINICDQAKLLLTIARKQNENKLKMNSIIEKTQKNNQALLTQIRVARNNRDYATANKLINDYTMEINKARAALEEVEGNHSFLDIELARQDEIIGNERKITEEEERKFHDEELKTAGERKKLFEQETKNMEADLEVETEKFNQTGDVDFMNNYINNTYKSVKANISSMQYATDTLNNKNMKNILNEQEKIVGHEKDSFDAIYNGFYMKTPLKKINDELKHILDMTKRIIIDDHSKKELHVELTEEEKKKAEAYEKSKTGVRLKVPVIKKPDSEEKPKEEPKAEDEKKPETEEKPKEEETKDEE